MRFACKLCAQVRIHRNQRNSSRVVQLLPERKLKTAPEYDQDLQSFGFSSFNIFHHWHCEKVWSNLWVLFPVIDTHFSVRMNKVHRKDIPSLPDVFTDHGSH